jgi:peptidoglycan hydrolase-like protein with peptidoglycan-binding domain
MKERGILMNIQKLLATTVLTIAVGSMATASQDVFASQKMLNSLGYNAGPIDGIVGSKTTNAMTNYYADKGMTFDGTIDGNEVTLLKTDAVNVALSVEDKAKQLDIGLAGYYVDETSMNGIGKYVLPSRDWMKKYVSQNDGIFYRDGASWGDFDGDGQSDYITWGVGVACMENSSKEGRVGCNSINASKPGIQIYSVDESFNYNKKNINEVFDWGTANDKGYPMGSSGIVVADFNNDGIDDFFIANASVKLKNGKFYYDGVNPVMISTGPFKWKASTHTGFKTDRKTKTYNGFSARGDAGDIDNDGDIDVITSEFEGAVCHFNDGKGNFKSKQCTKHGGFAITIGDFNNDGNLDFIGAHGHYNPNYKKHSPQKWMSKSKEKMALFYGNGKGGFKMAQRLDPYMIGNFMFSDVPDITAFDFDNDGDVDIVSSSVGMYYAGSVWLAYENVNGKLHISDANVTLAPLDEWQDPKVWGSMVKSESKHPWNTYCSKSQLIDVNNDGLMDVLCNNAVQHYRMTNHFLINKGNMQFDFVTPEEASKWVHWIK